MLPLPGTFIRVFILSITLLCLIHVLPALAASDLEIQDLRGALSEGGQSYALTFRVLNEGPSDANQIGCNVYVFSNQSLLVSQNIALDALGAGQSREESVDVALPSEPVTSIQVEIYDANEPDTQPSTNTATLQLKLGNVKKVDLQIVDAEMTNEQPIERRNITLKLKLRNNGPDISSFSRLTAELIVLNEPIARTDRRIERLAAGEELEFQTALNLTPSMTSNVGTIQITWAILDAGSMEASPDNNSWQIPVSLTPRMPDLVGKEIRVDRNGMLRFVVHNKGNARSGSSTTALYINGALVERYATPGLAPNASRGYQYAAGRVARDTNVLVVVDYNADVEEFSEENNRLTYRTK